MWVVIVAVVFLIALVAIWISFHLVGLLLMLLMAGLIGWIADRIVPGEIPYGWAGAIAFGLIGSWIGGLFIHIPPTIFGIHVIPGLIGAIVLALGAQAVGMLGSGRPKSDLPMRRD